MKLAYLLAFAPALLVANRATAEEQPLKLVQTIALKGVNGNLDHLAVDSKGMRLFVANKANNTLDVVDLKEGKLLRQIPDQVKVSGVTYVADTDRIYVGNGGGVCNCIDGKEYKIVFSTKCEKADNVYYNSTNKMIYVQGTDMYVLDATTGELKTKITAGGKTEEFRVDKKANKMYLNLKEGVIDVIDLKTNEVAEKFKLTMSSDLGPLAYDDKAGMLYAGCGGKEPMVIAVDAKTGKEVTNIAIPAGIDNLHFDSKRHRLYASCGAGSIAVIGVNSSKLELVAKIDTASKAKTSAFSSKLSRLYVGVPKQAGAEGPTVQVFDVLPAIKSKAGGEGK
jgi:DNA-binding beta-propeller fold protein YncE